MVGKPIVNFAFAIAAIGIYAGCVVGGEEAADGADQQFALNRPHQNGCSPSESVLSCAAQKGIDPSVACGYLQRVPNAFFTTTRAGTFIANDLWSVEHVEYALPTARSGFYAKPEANYGTWGNAPLEWICRNYHTEELYITYVPTAMGCASLGGRWDAPYCRPTRTR